MASFSPRKRELVVYLAGDHDAQTYRLDDLGPHRTGTGCLYVRDLSDVDRDALRRIIETSVEARSLAAPSPKPD